VVTRLSCCIGEIGASGERSYQKEDVSRSGEWGQAEGAQERRLKVVQAGEVSRAHSWKLISAEMLEAKHRQAGTCDTGHGEEESIDRLTERWPSCKSRGDRALPGLGKAPGDQPLHQEKAPKASQRRKAARIFQKKGALFSPSKRVNCAFRKAGDAARIRTRKMHHMQRALLENWTGEKRRR
jgi:hypothetical protein